MIGAKKIREGATITWAASGGDYLFTPGALAAAAARQGAKGDLGSPRLASCRVRLTVLTGTAMTAGKALDLYWAPSTSSVAATGNVGGASGADAAYAGIDANAAACLPLMQYIGTLYVTANAAATLVKDWTFSPITQYGQPVLVNNGDQALGASTHKVEVTPLYELES